MFVILLLSTSVLGITVNYADWVDSLGCADLRSIAIGAPLWHTQRKELLRGKLNNSVDVIVERPFDGSAFWAQLNQSDRESVYLEYFRKERLLARKLTGEFVPTFLGGCFSSFGILIHVTEPLRLFADVVDDELVDWRQRVRIAVNAVRMLAFLDNMPIGKKAIYGDVWTSHFGVDSELRVKFLDFQSFFVYETRFGLYKCQEDVHCHDKFWTSDEHPKVLVGLRDAPPDDFRCVRGSCNGIDSLTQLMAFCKLLIEPLFESFDLPSEAKPIHDVIDSCLRPKRVDRASPATVIASLEKLVPPKAKLRPLTLAR